MPSTTINALRYPSLSDPANGPQAVQNLANDLDGKVVNVCTSGTRPGSPVTGSLIYETDTGLLRLYRSGAWVTLQDANVSTTFLNPPRSYLTQTGAGSVASATWTPLAWDTEVYDTDSMHSTTTNPTRVIATTPGLYFVQASGACTGSNVGTRGVMVRKNAAGNPASGTQYVQQLNQVGNAGGVVAGSSDVYLAAGDYIEVFFYQNSGGALSTSTGTWVQARWVASS